jgi:hypothetical protein
MSGFESGIRASATKECRWGVATGSAAAPHPDSTHDHTARRGSPAHDRMDSAHGAHAAATEDRTGARTIRIR